MSTTDDGTTDATLEGERVCPDCDGFGVWNGVRSGDDLMLECATCGMVFTGRDRNKSEGY